MKNGFALITSLAVVVVVALATAGIFQAIGSHANMKANNFQDVQARYLAEAGMEYVLFKFRGGTAFATTETTHYVDPAALNRSARCLSTPLAGSTYRIETVNDDYTRQQ